MVCRESHNPGKWTNPGVWECYPALRPQNILWSIHTREVEGLQSQRYIQIEMKMVPDLGERGISRHENIPYAHHTVAPSKMWGDLQLYKGPAEFQVCSSSACHLIPLADKSSLCGFAWETDHRRPPESPQKGQHWPISLTRGLQPHWSIGVVLSQYLTH